MDNSAGLGIVSGPTAEWSNAGYLIVGNLGTGMLDISEWWHGEQHLVAHWKPAGKLRVCDGHLP